MQMFLCPRIPITFPIIKLLGDGLVNTTKLVEYLRRSTTARDYTEWNIHKMIKAVNSCKEHKALNGDKLVNLWWFSELSMLLC